MVDLLWTSEKMKRSVQVTLMNGAVRIGVVRAHSFDEGVGPLSAFKIGDSWIALGAVAMVEVLSA